MMTNPIVSIIMPAYNAGRFIAEAIESVLEQDYPHFELLIVNDGSTDNTGEIAATYTDPRVRYFVQENKGVSAARNLALDNMRGDFFCFLDADDIFPTNSLKSRLEVFERNEAIDFVDGIVDYVDGQLNSLGTYYRPDFQGDPLPLLLRLDRRCLFGNTWMLRRKTGICYQFDESLTHAEDLYFYLSICNQYKTTYSYTTETVLLYRQSSGSAMKNLRGLEHGYWLLLRKIRENIEHSHKQLRYLKLRITRIMFLSYLIDGRNPVSAIRVLMKYFY